MAVDGTKVAAAATHHATRSYQRIAKEILEEAAEIDAREDGGLLGEARGGDELPEGLRTSGDRRKQGCRGRPSRHSTRNGRPRPSRCRATGPRAGLAECKRRLEQDWALERKVVTEHAAWHARGMERPPMGRGGWPAPAR